MIIGMCLCDSIFAQNVIAVCVSACVCAALYDRRFLTPLVSQSMGVACVNREALCYRLSKLSAIAEKTDRKRR